MSPVAVFGMPFVVASAPNPFVPTPGSVHIPDLQFMEYQEALRMAVGRGGTAFVLEVFLPPDSASGGVQHGLEIEASVMVYDLAGNPVYRREGRIPDQWFANKTGGTTEKIGFHWDGWNDQNMKCRPGVYRGLVRLVTRSSNGTNQVTNTQQQILALAVGK